MRSEQPLVLSAAMLVMAGALAGCKPTQARNPDPRNTDRVVVVAPAEHATGAANRYIGVVGARVESGLGFRVPGKVVARLVDTGQTVTRGQMLMRIDPADYGHALVAQTGNVAAARAKWIQEAADERRDRGLSVTGAISRSAYDEVKAAADSARALLDAAMAQQRLAQNQEDYSILVADADGTVMQTLAEPGQVVAAGEIVVRLAHAGPREAVVDLPEGVRPSVGSTATASVYGNSRRGTARLRQLSDTADPRTRTFEARYVMSGAAAAAPLGATVTIALDAEDEAARLSVPLGALNDEGQGPGVWVLDAGTSRVAFRPVQIQSLGAEMAVLRGLRAGDNVVAAGGHFLHDGEKVRAAVIRAAMQ